MSVSIDGNIAIVGAPANDDAGNNAGSAYTFVRDANGWKEQTKLIGKDVEAGNGFGNSVFIRRNLAIVGAHRHTHSGIRFAGAAYIFVRDGDRWTEQAKLTPEDPAGGQRFGTNHVGKHWFFMGLLRSAFISAAVSCTDANYSRDPGVLY